MHISAVELENIKSHASSKFTFTRGTTAITGSNGAGKTSIIEAIAWALFDLLEYKKDDLIRRGEKKGSVKVTFESGLDEREYIVYRDTGAGYYVTDPRLGTRIAEKKEEVIRFLWQHLGLEPGTDLKSLFRQAIGVPQGTFTAIFLEGATERKTAFDRLLKVEEYRQAAEKLRDTTRFIDQSVSGIRESIARAEGELSRSDAVEEEYKTYQERAIKLTAESKALEKEVNQKRLIVEKLDGLERVEAASANIQKDKKQLKESLETIDKARLELIEIKPRVAEQEKIEVEITDLREKVAAARAIEDQIKTLDSRIERLRASYRSNAEQIKDAEAKTGDAAETKKLEERETILVKQIAEWNASLDRDRKFQAEIKSGLCPILSQKCLNLKEGETLESFISSQFTDLKQHIADAEAERSIVANGLKHARDAERFAAILIGLRERETELATEGKHLAAERKDLENRTSELATSERQFAEIEKKLTSLKDPRSRLRILENEISKESELRKRSAKIDTEVDRIETDRRSLIDALSDHPELIGSGYDNAKHIVERNALHELSNRLASVKATLAATTDREEKLAAELKHFADIRKSLAVEFQEKERLEKVAEATSFIRDTLKEAAPRVARNYVHHVSLEANQLFREISGNAELTLKWGEDYAIMLEEDGYERPFQSFSGGEQMAAALSVRLALLKQLTDIRVAFFDEPTTNMDAERRENLAMQISRITNFDQLFVISHDETFDGYVDGVLAIG